MILRMQVLAAHPDQGGTSPHHVVTKTPIPTPNGVLWKDPEILPEGDPRTRTVAGSSGSD